VARPQAARVARGNAHVSTRAAKTGRRTWQQDPEGRRVRILEAASRAFARDGYRGARVDLIAADADVAEGTVYHLFGSKRGLLVAVGAEYGRGLAEAAFGDLPPDFHPRDVARIVERCFEYVRTSDAALGIFLLASDPNEGGPAEDANRAEMLRAIEAALEGWMARGLIPPMNPRIAAELHFGLVESAVRDCFLRHGGADEAEYVAETARALGAMLGQRPSVKLTTTGREKKR